MINIKNILKVLLVALFVCAYSGDVWAADEVKTCTPACQSFQDCKCFSDGSCKCVKKNNSSTEKVEVTGTGGKADSVDFCSSDQGIFTDLVSTGVKIFRQLRDLIYVVAGFGIIAVAVGGFFGNLNWKWLGAIVISLVVIATAGELVVLLTGCETFGSSLITNTLTNPAPMSTEEYNQNYTEEASDNNNVWIDDWSDTSIENVQDVPNNGI